MPKKTKKLQNNIFSREFFCILCSFLVKKLYLRSRIEKTTQKGILKILIEIIIMKKSIIICAGLCVALAFTSCKPKESMYKKAYDKAKAAEATAVVEEPAVVETPVVTPMVETPVNKTTVVANSENVNVRTEDLSVVEGAALKNFSVVVGSFGLKANAENLYNKLKAAGYNSRIAYNSARNMYRVVASSYDAKADAVSSRDQLRSQYPDAWLLFQK